MPPESFQPVVIDIEDQALPGGHMQTMRITVWVERVGANDAPPPDAPALAIAFLERALRELRSQGAAETIGDRAVEATSAPSYRLDAEAL